jgi:hypothetical protein
MLFCDINDIILYLMELHVLKSQNTAMFRKNVFDFYFIECLIWTLLHTFEYLTKDNYTPLERSTKKENIVRYFMDTILSHNDYSHKLFSISLKKSGIIGILSSLLGLKLVWK